MRKDDLRTQISLKTKIEGLSQLFETKASLATVNQHLDDYEEATNRKLAKKASLPYNENQEDIPHRVSRRSPPELVLKVILLKCFPTYHGTQSSLQLVLSLATGLMDICPALWRHGQWLRQHVSQHGVQTHQMTGLSKMG